MIIVLDSNVILSGILWGGPPARVLERVELGMDKAFTSRSMLRELDAVLKRPKFRRPLEKAGVSRQDILRWTIVHTTLIVPKPLSGPGVPGDPGDDKFLACAESGRADYLITGDVQHLIRLGRWGRTRIVTPQAYLKKVEKPHPAPRRSRRRRR